MMTPERFRTARKSLGMTQKQLAEALRMGTHGWQTISKWEGGGATIPGPVQVAMEHLANCPTKPGTKAAKETDWKNAP